MAAWWRRLTQRLQRQLITIEVIPEGFALRQAEQSVAILWNDIQRVATFKRDLGTVDLICIAVETRDNAFELHDEMPGYDAFETAMNDRLAIDPGWKLRVMFPAFATNLETIFDRGAATP